ncbi:putative hemK methyltransferase family member 2-like [Apostichopus japonicus]|uniref:Methyltransferase HEMK2 n=1 Tax=Stichopus japonicus TaxID=307972 RepID=A0A2G8KYF6_STIJA|nr:putative hemK methyltransferase family member 2-like [Apostichopus japonicus]
MNQEVSQLFPTPDFSHLSENDFQDVYEPAEDSFLLLDALEQEAESLNSLRPLICVEVGCGSGIVITFLKKLLSSQCVCLAVDSNHKATSSTVKTADQNKAQVEAVTSDLLGNLQPRIEGKIDVLVFNPPYVVTPPEEVRCPGLPSSWAGGVNGRQVTDRLLSDVHRLLSPSGVFYLITIRENKPDEIRQMLKDRGLESTVIIERKAGPERLNVIKFQRRISAVT